VLEGHAPPFGDGHRRALPVEIHETDLRENPQQAPGMFGGPRLPTQDRLELSSGRTAAVAQRPVAGG
jgi:hypothetical protein